MNSDAYNTWLGSDFLRDRNNFLVDRAKEIKLLIISGRDPSDFVDEIRSLSGQGRVQAPDVGQLRFMEELVK